MGSTYRMIPKECDNPDAGMVRRKVVVLDGVEGYNSAFTATCSGCFESLDGQPCGSYPWDKKACCYIGSGCHECGYTGKRRVHFFVPFSEVDHQEPQ